jgi:hypothetical protein
MSLSQENRALIRILLGQAHAHHSVIGGDPSERAHMPGLFPRALLGAGMRCTVGT